MSQVQIIRGPDPRTCEEVLRVIAEPLQQRQDLTHLVELARVERENLDRQYLEPVRERERALKGKIREAEDAMRVAAKTALPSFLAPGRWVTYDQPQYLSDVFEVTDVRWDFSLDASMNLRVLIRVLMPRGGLGSRGRWLKDEQGRLKTWWNPEPYVCDPADIARLAPAPDEHPRIQARRRRLVKCRLKGVTG